MRGFTGTLLVFDVAALLAWVYREVWLTALVGPFAGLPPTLVVPLAPSERLRVVVTGVPLIAALAALPIAHVEAWLWLLHKRGRPVTRSWTLAFTLASCCAWGLGTLVAYRFAVTATSYLIPYVAQS